MKAVVLSGAADRMYVMFGMVGMSESASGFTNRHGPGRLSISSMFRASNWRFALTADNWVPVAISGVALSEFISTAGQSAASDTRNLSLHISSRSSFVF
jgi:hypothetical protein